MYTTERKKIVSTEKAPKAIGPYSQAIRTENLVFTAGQVGLDPATMELVEGGVEPRPVRCSRPQACSGERRFRSKVCGQDDCLPAGYGRFCKDEWGLRRVLPGKPARTQHSPGCGLT